MPSSAPECRVAVVVDVLPGYGIAHATTADGQLFGIRRATPGVAFDDIKVGDIVEVEVRQPFSRVDRARIVALPTTAPA
jgi:hypothetical protein